MYNDDYGMPGARKHRIHHIYTNCIREVTAMSCTESMRHLLSRLTMHEGLNRVRNTIKHDCLNLPGARNCQNRDGEDDRREVKNIYLARNSGCC